MTPTLEERKRKAQEETDARGFCRRSFPVDGLELRDGDNGSVRISGYASITGRWYPVGWYEEKIEPGAFKRSLAEKPDVQLLINHEGLALARTTNDTLTLAEDARGLRVEAELDRDRPAVKELAAALRRGDVDQMSFAFLPRDQEWSDDRSKRSIRDARLHRGDVSVVNQGASPSTTVALRSHEGQGVGLIPGYGSIARARRDRAMAGAGGVKARRSSEKYTQTEVDELGREGKAHKAADGHYRFPIKDHEDVKNAVKALGRIPAAERPSVRRFVMKRARELKATYAIPATWKADGTLA